MPSQANSPAVQSMRDEQLRQRKATRKAQLDDALEGTFPASDPVSLTHTAVSTGRAGKQETDRLSGGRQDNARPANRAKGSSAYRAESDLRSRWEDIEAAVRRRPLSAIGIVAAFAYVLGAKR